MQWALNWGTDVYQCHTTGALDVKHIGTYVNNYAVMKKVKILLFYKYVIFAISNIFADKIFRNMKH